RIPLKSGCIEVSTHSERYTQQCTVSTLINLKPNSAYCLKSCMQAAQILSHEGAEKTITMLDQKLQFTYRKESIVVFPTLVGRMTIRAPMQTSRLLLTAER
ncbi:hypothetical protein KC19_4G098300, partial [Ceratodon purpureus]